MKTDLNPKSVFRTTLALAIALGFGSRLANAQDAAVSEAEAAEEYAPLPAIGSPGSDLDLRTSMPLLVLGSAADASGGSGMIETSSRSVARRRE